MLLRQRLLPDQALTLFLLKPRQQKICIDIQQLALLGGQRSTRPTEVELGLSQSFGAAIAALKACAAQHHQDSALAHDMDCRVHSMATTRVLAANPLVFRYTNNRQ
ncbi:hypothetical protein D3C72_1940280 [compost metagenome]